MTLKIAQNPLKSGGSLLPGGECWQNLDRRAAKRRLGRWLLMYHRLPEGPKGWRTGCGGNPPSLPHLLDAALRMQAGGRPRTSWRKSTA